MWDAFMSHASEDKDEVALPLAEALRSYGLRIWLDRFTLKIGDSLREKIDEGLAQSGFGVVILSAAFFAKKWPSKELNAIFGREIAGQQVLLPVWHGLSHAEVLVHSPLIADKVAVSTSVGIPAVARELVRVIRPEAFQTQITVDDARRAAGRLIDQLTQCRPELDYRVTMGSQNPGRVATGDDALIPEPRPIRIDTSVRDAEVYRKNPLGLQFSLQRHTWDKAQQVLLDGEALTLGPEEVLKLSSNVFELAGILVPEVGQGADRHTLQVKPHALAEFTDTRHGLAGFFRVERTRPNRCSTGGLFFRESIKRLDEEFIDIAMKALVLDVSACMPWCCEDETTAASEENARLGDARKRVACPVAVGLGNPERRRCDRQAPAHHGRPGEGVSGSACHSEFQD